MAIDLEDLARRAFFSEQVVNASEAIERARRQFTAATHGGATSFELVAPAAPDQAWLEERLVRPLVYYCESAGTSLPACPSVFLSLFRGDRLCCIAVADVLAWAEAELGVGADELRARYGTHETETALR